ncbi:MAG: hypothetical protein ACRENI_04765 [Gemmatimonadaceae bacterium]
MPSANGRNRILVVASLFTVLLVPAAAAQQAPQPGAVVFSQNKCPFENVPRVNAALDSILAPVLDEFVAEGKLLAWGVLEHGWGDEWNWNIYYTVESHRTFLDFWSAYVARLNERHPGWFAQFAPLCTEHKDNIYSVRVARPQR